MRYLQYILYGVIVGRWLLGVKGRLSTCKVQGRYVVIGMHSGKDEYILVGYTGDEGKADDVARFVDENTMFYIPVSYDLLDPNDRAEFEKKLFCPYIDDEDRSVIEDARGML